MRAIAAGIGFLVLLLGLLLAVGVLPFNAATVGGLAFGAGLGLAVGFVPYTPRVAP